jgi:hypothetical protein
MTDLENYIPRPVALFGVKDKLIFPNRPISDLNKLQLRLKPITAIVKPENWLMPGLLLDRRLLLLIPLAQIFLSQSFSFYVHFWQQDEH